MPIAIIGYYPVSNEKKYDYCGVALPFGFIKNGGMYLFNAKEIDCILFESIQNLESELMKEIFFEL